MAFLSELIGRMVTNINGENIGQLEDVVACARGDMPHPLVKAIVIKTKTNHNIVVPVETVAVLLASAIPLKLPGWKTSPFFNPVIMIFSWQGMYWINKSSIPTGYVWCVSMIWN